MHTTIRDVAKEAGVSAGTVSRAFNGYTDISPDTKKRIFQAANALGYTPNVNARSLSSKVAPNIGIIVSGLMENDGKDNFFLLLLQGIYRYALANNLEVTLYATDSDNQHKKSYTSFCKEHNICGIILNGITTNDPYFNELVDSGIPCVLIDVRLKGKNLGYVSTDNYEAAKVLTQYLFDRNHKELMIIAGKKNTTVNIERTASVYQTYKENQRKISKDRILYCDFKEEMAYEKAKAYLEQYGKSQITAFLCFSDIMALGVMRAVYACGYSIPDDFSIVGFDGIPMGSYVTPSLTTIAQDVKEMGHQSARLLHQMVQNEETEKDIYIPYEFLERNSVKTLPLSFTAPVNP